jgi:hypothetical protein
MKVSAASAVLSSPVFTSADQRNTGNPGSLVLAQIVPLFKRSNILRFAQIHMTVKLSGYENRPSSSS